MRIRVLPHQPHCFAFGGFEIQMLSTLAAMQACEVDARPMDPWERSADFEILHVWGLSVAHLPAVHWARKAGKRIVMTALLPYPTLRGNLRHLLTSFHGLGRLHQELLDTVDALVVVNERQAATARRTYRVRAEKVTVIPNIVDAKFFESSTSTLQGPVQFRNYILCTGNICSRKNQLRLVQACLVLGCPLVIIGNVLTGEERYGDALKAAVAGSQNILWLRGMDAGSDELVAAYRNCTAFALPSFLETQPISLLEAGAMHKPLLLGDRPYANQKYYQNAVVVDPSSIDGIRRGVERLLAQPRQHVPPREFLEECRRERVGTAYRNTFEQLGT